MVIQRGWFVVTPSPLFKIKKQIKLLTLIINLQKTKLKDRMLLTTISLLIDTIFIYGIIR